MKSIIWIAVLALMASACSLAGKGGSTGNPPNAKKEITGKDNQNPAPKKKNSIEMKFVYIEPGTFLMGSPLTERPRSASEAKHEVTLTKGFHMSNTEVTVGQFRAFIDATGYVTDAEKNEPVDGGGCSKIIDKEGNFLWKLRADADWHSPGFDQSDDMPVTCVSWNDAQAFIDWLSNETGRTYRLPTEAEWEYAARAGSRSARFWGDEARMACSYANVADLDSAAFESDYPKHPCSDGYVYTAPVGSYPPNAFGLNDMIGNVWEWCQDWFGVYPAGPVTNPKGPSADVPTGLSGGQDPLHIVRGCSWSKSPLFCRSATRQNTTRDHRSNDIGFRLVMDE